MGEVIEFEPYRLAKQQGISVEEFRSKSKLLNSLLAEITEDIESEYISVTNTNKAWPEGYTFVLKQDIDVLYDCDHESWSIVEEDFQAICNECDMSAWSAPW